MKVITICGSMKYIDTMMEVSERVEMQGNVVLIPIYNPSKPNKDSFTEEEIKILDAMHRERIKLSDAILVVDVDGYIGNSTKSEIEFAKDHGKEIMYYSKMENL